MTRPPDLGTEPFRFDFLALMRALERANAEKPRIGDASTRAEEYVLLGQDPYLAFPAANIASAKVDEKGRLKLILRFLGLFGPQGALPLATTEEAYGWLLARDDAFPRFLDVFQHRFLQLFFRAWADARPIAHHDRPTADRFADWIASTAGVGTAPYRDADSLSRGAVLAHAGLVGPKVKSASRLRSLIESLFGVKVEIDQFVGSWLAFEPGEQSRLGAAMSTLGKDAFLGSSAYSVEDKIRIRVHVKSLEEYREFLPTGRHAEPLADAVFLLLGDELDWDVEVAIPAGAVEPARLGAGARLGWTGWMAPDWSDTDTTLLTDARFHLASRLADRRRRGKEVEGGAAAATPSKATRPKDEPLAVPVAAATSAETPAPDLARTTAPPDAVATDAGVEPAADQEGLEPAGV